MFSKFGKDISDVILSHNLNIDSTLCDDIFNIPAPHSIENNKRYEIMIKVDKETESYTITWKKKDTIFDKLMSYNIVYKKIDSLKLDKGEIRNKNIERLLT